MKDAMFNKALSKAEMSTRQSPKSLVTNFLGNHQSAGYEKEIEELLKSFRQLRARMSVKLHTLQSHWLFSKELWRFEWRAPWQLLPRNLHYGRVLAKPMGCKLSHWLLLVIETGCGSCQAQEEVPEKTFHR